MSVIETERLILRQVSQDDHGDILAMISDPAVKEYDLHGFRNPDTAQLWVNRSLERYARDGFGMWAVELKTNPGFIGMMGIINHHIPEVDELEVAWHLRRVYWGNGYATEGAMACRDYGFNKLGQPKMVSLISPLNELSMRVARRIGMAQEKVIFINKFERDTAVFGVLRSDK